MHIQHSIGAAQHLLRRSDASLCKKDNHRLCLWNKKGYAYE